MSPPKHALMLKIKQPMPITNVITPTSTPEPPLENDLTSTQRPTPGTESMQGPSLALDEVRRVQSWLPNCSPTACRVLRTDAASLRLLQVPELLTWIGNNKLNALKSRRKDELIAAIVNSPEFMQVSKSAIQEIVESRKLKKGSKRQLGASP
ncbi:hypothetical protein H4582DRAFT_2071014 [Lactarius indigo]|nr:hypothetical protein H4582DRAFT_2071014 [Lactarius indigo]